MRWLIGIFAVFLTLWCGWWFAGRYVILDQAGRLIEDERARGAQLDLPGFGLAGFPSRFDLSADSITWRDPSGRFAYEGGAAHSYAMSWKPWHLILWLPDSQKLTIDGEVLGIDGQKLHASLRAKPSLDVPLALAALSAEDLRLTSSAGLSLGITTLSLRIEAQDGGAAPAAPAYHLGAALTGITPDPALIAALAAVDVPQMPEAPLPDQIDRFHLNAMVTLSAPLDRHAGETKPQIVAIELVDASLIWGELNMASSGSLSPDDQGYAAGTIRLTVKGWQQLPRLLVASRVIAPNMAGLLTSMLRGLASESGDPAQLQMDLVMKDGWVSFGPLPLGPAPKLRDPLPPAG